MTYVIQPTEVWEAALRLDGCAGQCKEPRTKVPDLYPQWFAHGRVVVLHDVQRCPAQKQVRVARRILSGTDAPVDWSQKHANPIRDINNVLREAAQDYEEHLRHRH